MVKKLKLKNEKKLKFNIIFENSEEIAEEDQNEEDEELKDEKNDVIKDNSNDAEIFIERKKVLSKLHYLNQQMVDLLLDFLEVKEK